MSKFKFDKVLKNMQDMKKVLPAKLGATGTVFFNNSFRNQGFTDRVLTLWEKRKGSRRDSGRNILVKTGRLKGAVNNSLKIATWDQIKWKIPGGEVPYAAIHNNGGTILKKSRAGVVRLGLTKKFEHTGRFTKEGKLHIKKTVLIGAHTINMPKRQFIGDSQKLREIFKNKIDSAMRACFKTK